MDALADGKPERYKFFEEMLYPSFLKLYSFKLEKAIDERRQVDKQSRINNRNGR